MNVLDRSVKRRYAMVQWPLEMKHKWGQWYGHTARVLVRYDWDGGDQANGEPPGVESWEPVEVQSLGSYEWAEHTSAPRLAWVENPRAIGAAGPWLMAAISDQIEQDDWRIPLVLKQIAEQHTEHDGSE